MNKLLQSEDKWITSMGAWFAGERVVFRGKDLHHDLRDMNWMELYLYSITGREFTEEQLRVLNAIWTFTSFPDPRLWNNRVVALASTARSTPTLALSAAIAVSEASIFGHGPSVHAINFFLETKKACDCGEIMGELVKLELKKRRSIYGYGRPLYRSDERIEHLKSLMEETQLDKGAHVLLAFEVERFLVAGRWRMYLNIAGLGAAVAADLGFNPKEFHLFKIPCFLAGMPPIYLEANEKDEGTFFPLRCERINYHGVNRRHW